MQLTADQDISAPAQVIALLVQGEVVGMRHDPLAVWSALPDQDRLGRIHSNINIVGDIASKEVDLHCVRNRLPWEIPAQ